MLDDSFTPEPFQRLLTALMELPPPPLEASDGGVQLVLEAMDLALHTPPACPHRIVAMAYLSKHARHRLGLQTLHDVHALLEQHAQGDDGDAELARLLWNVGAREHVRALRVLAWFLSVYDITELAQWHAWMGTAGFEEALRESLDTLGAVAVALLWQAKSGRTDHGWVSRFARRVMGRSISEGNAMLAFRDMAEAMGESPLVLARRVAQLERVALGVEDAPAMRVLWWQCVAEALAAQIASEVGEAADTDATASAEEWCVELSPAVALRHGEAGVALERQVRAWPTGAPMVTALRLRQRSWARGLGLWLEIEGQGRLSAGHQAAIAARFEAAGHQAPRLRHMNAASGQHAAWLAAWQWEDAPWVPRDMAVADVRRWAQDTALNATEHWLLMRGMLVLAGKSLAYGAKLAVIDVKREASNEKKF